MREKKNVIVVMLDTLQFNYLGCYGNTRVKTPNIDRFATEGVVFENAYTEGLPTVPCRRAMLTGRYTLPVKGWSQPRRQRHHHCGSVLGAAHRQLPDPRLRAVPTAQVRVLAGLRQGVLPARA